MVARVMDLTGMSSRIGVDIIASPCLEFLMGLVKFGMEESRETFEDGGGWFDHVRTLASPELLHAVDALAGKDGGPWGSLAGIPLGLDVQWPEDHTVSGLIAHLEAMPPVDLWLVMNGYYLPPVREEIGPDRYRRAALGDEASRRAVLHAVRKFEELEEEPPLFSMEAEEAKVLILTALRLWHREVFAAGEAEVSEVLARDAAAKRSLAGGMSPRKLIEVATNGLEFRGEPWVRRVVLVPQVVMRPWNVSCAWEDRWIICYPVADESMGADRDVPPARMLRLYKALSDEKRLRILKRLVTGSATLHELADSVGLAKSSTHHHMVILRSAGLVTVTDGLQSVYTLRTEPIPEASALLDAFLKEGPS